MNHFISATNSFNRINVRNSEEGGKTSTGGFKMMKAAKNTLPRLIKITERALRYLLKNTIDTYKLNILGSVIFPYKGW